VTLIGVAALASVSRSAILCLAVAVGVFIALMPPVKRLVALCALPFAAIAAFMSAHGLIGTLSGFFTLGTSDPSVQYRLYDYPVAERLWQDAPIFGRGGGTYITTQNPLLILDNQYLHTAIELGLVGLIALAAFFLVPAIGALVARARSTSEEMRLLCAALAGAGFAAAVCSLTFDSLSFPMFINVYALLMGLMGACWRLTAAGTVRVPREVGPVAVPGASLSWRSSTT
jgi:O-antigen ligase